MSQMISSLVAHLRWIDLSKQKFVWKSFLEQDYSPLVLA